MTFPRAAIVESRRLLRSEHTKLLLLCVDADGTNVLKARLLIVEPKQKLIPNAPDHVITETAASVHLSTLLDVTIPTITLDFKLVPEITTKADFAYSIAPDTISITDTTKGQAVGDERHQGCLEND